MLVLDQIHVGFLKKLDLKIWKFIWDILHLSHNFSTSAFYLHINDGRLGISCLRWHVPMMTYYLDSSHVRIKNILIIPNGQCLSSKTKFANFFKKDLYNRCDRAGFSHSSAVLQAYLWVSDSSSLFMGRDYIANFYSALCMFI